MRSIANLRCRIICLSALITLCAALLLIWAQRASGRAGGIEFGYDRIGIGMTEAEVVAAVGRPPGDYSSDNATFTNYMGPTPLSLSLVLNGNPGYVREWKTSSAKVEVWFGDGGRVLEKRYYTRSSESGVGRVRRKLKTFVRSLV
jgi:hypothetical protein